MVGLRAAHLYVVDREKNIVSPENPRIIFILVSLSVCFNNRVHNLLIVCNRIWPAAFKHSMV